MHRRGDVKISVNALISVSLSLYCIIISLVILFSGLFDSARSLQIRRLEISRIFRFFIFSNIGFMATDVLTKVFGGHMEPYRFFIARTSIFLHFAFGTLLLTSMTMYMIAYISCEVKVSRKLLVFVYSICGLSLLLIIISQFNDMYYYFDEYNIYRRGPLWLLSQIIPLLALFVNFIIIIYYRRAMQGRVTLFFIMYLILPVAGISLHSAASGITFTSLGTTLTILVFYLTVQSEVFRNSESRLRKIEQKLDLQKTYYEKLRAQIEETKAARHDLRHHLTVVQSYVNKGDKERLQTYLNEHLVRLPVDKEILLCRNFAVNAVMWYYMSIAENEGVQVETCLDLGEQPGISDSDLCIVFGNCVENAIEACRKFNGKKFIKINSKLTGQMLTITIDNSFDGSINNGGGFFLSHKGIGISSVKAVAQKYGGTAQFKAEGDIFQVSILLNIKQGDQDRDICASGGAIRKSLS